MLTIREVADHFAVARDQRMLDLAVKRGTDIDRTVPCHFPPLALRH
jgi:hypothetical protein